MTLIEYITDIGDEKAAELFNVSTRTAAAYRRGERVPRPRKAREIEKITNGKVTFENCYGVAA